MDPAEVLLFQSYCAVISETATLVHYDKDKDEIAFKCNNRTHIYNMIGCHGRE